jgi:hypothetical protein
MMKKYNKPEIVTLALETVDVIETSGAGLAASAITNNGAGVEGANLVVAKVQTIEKQITDMSSTWSW